MKTETILKCFKYFPLLTNLEKRIYLYFFKNVDFKNIFFKKQFIINFLNNSIIEQKYKFFDSRLWNSTLNIAEFAMLDGAVIYNHDINWNDRVRLQYNFKNTIFNNLDKIRKLKSILQLKNK